MELKISRSERVMLWILALAFGFLCGLIGNLIAVIAVIAVIVLK